MSDWWDERIDSFGDALDRRIDNEIVGEPMPTPYTQDKNTVYTNTSNDETGLNKVAGTGDRIIKQVPNSVLYVGLAAIAGVVAWKVL